MLRPPDAEGRSFDLVGLGEISLDDVLLVDEVPPWGGKASVKRRVRVGGGQVATAMYAARRLGLRTALVGTVGDTSEGSEALADLEAAGVDLRGVVREPGDTHQAVIVVDARGDRTVLWTEPEKHAPHALQDTARRHAIDALVASARILHVDGNILSAATHAARVARACGGLVSCDLDRYEGATTDALLALVDVCIVSSGFMASYGRAADHAAAVALLPSLAERLARPGIACVTLGVRGAAALEHGALVESPGYTPPAPIVDTTACGDTFRAAFLTALIEGKDLTGRLRFANAAAALKTRDIGRLGCPTRAQIDRFLQSTR